jgi:RNA polymerase sigma-70 factor (ECF subfamily)
MSDTDCIDDQYDENFIINYRKYFRPVTMFIKKMVFDRDISEELCQDVFLRVYERNIRLDPDSSKTMNFLCTVAKYAAIDYLRRKNVEKEKIKSMNLKEAILDRQFYEDIENAWLRGEIISTMSDIIDSFPEKKRDLFIALNFGNMTGASVARDNGLTVYHMRKIEEEFHRKIRENLGHYFDCQDFTKSLDRQKGNI